LKLGLEKVKNKEVAPIVIEKEVDDFVDENDAMEVSEETETAALLRSGGN
jgi:hypothetical protein